MPGTYAERITISKPLKLQGDRAVLDGLAGRLDGRFIGIEVKANNVEITGFIVQNYERGILVHPAEGFVLRGNEIRNNLSKDPPPTSRGVTKSDGVVLVTVQNSDISENYIHGNGTIGVWLSAGSHNNTVRRNRLENNNTQQRMSGNYQHGAGILTCGANNTRNQIVDNDISGNDWGILIGCQPDSSNVIRNNRLRGNYRAAIGIAGEHNIIEGNVATGNGLGNFWPSCRLDFMDDRNNTWRNNTGRLGPPFPSTADSWRPDYRCPAEWSASTSSEWPMPPE